MYPALAVLQAMEGNYREFLWVGGEGGMESELINRMDLPFREIPAAGVHGVGLRTLPSNVFKLLKGILQSRRIIKEFQPDVIFYTGGYVAAPMAVAGMKVPSILYVPDIEPGFALKFLAKFARVIALTTETSKQFFSKSKELVVTGYPIRSELRKYSKAEASKILNLTNDLPVLMVYGGSKGAHSINQVIIKNLETLLSKFQLIHIVGNYDWEQVQAVHNSLPENRSQNYHCYPYLHEEMSAAFSSADLCICRSGASTLGELPFFGLPAILVPYPYAWRYQKTNAEYLVNNQAALLISDEELEKRLMVEVNQLLDSPEKLTEMSNAMSSLAKINAASQIASLISNQVSSSNRKGGLS